MFWEEKIDRLKSRFSREQFRVPFTDWAEIFRKVEAKFVSSGWPVDRFSNWSEGLKEKKPIRDISKKEVEKEISKLDTAQNYWVFIVFANNPTSRQHVYDCSVDAVSALLSIAPADFYIGHKKYEWLVYFKASSDENTLSLVKSGDPRTPFD